MANIIYKYPVQMVSAQQVLLPKDATILSTGLQQDRPVIWCLLAEDTIELEAVELLLLPTGAAFSDKESNLIFIGTLQFNNGLVFHLFKKVRP